MDLSPCIKHVINEFIEEPFDPRIFSATDINNGFCEEFAEIVAKRCGGVIRKRGFDNPTQYPSHAWVEYEGEHYDAEAPEGVNSPEELPIFKRR